LEEVIERERAAIGEVKAAADIVIDTTGLNIHQLKSQLSSLFGTEDIKDSLQVSVTSFGFKHGVPIDVDMILDVRFLPNPHWDENLRPLSGLDQPVKDHVLGSSLATEFTDKVNDLLELILPAYVQEGRSYFTIGIGCTGGRHRSVALAGHIAERIAEMGYQLRVTHRDINL
jgi:UPF0042 nucleotide-binding protein